MGKALISLVNPNMVYPPIPPYALDILATALKANGFDVEVLDLTFHRDHWRTAVYDYFINRRPLLVGITIRNTDTVYAQQQRVFLGEHKKIIDEIRRCTVSPMVGGGVGFSTMPFVLVDYFGLDFGISGPGELLLVRLADAVLGNGSLADVPGLIINDGAGNLRQIAPDSAGRDRVTQVDRTSVYQRLSGVPWQVDNLEYYRRGGLGVILTKNGCPFSCSFCVEPMAKGNRFARRDVAAVVDEMETLVYQGVWDLHTADSEFNLNIVHSKAVLSEIIRRKNNDRSSPLHHLRLWVYIQPAPFDEEFAALLSEAGCAGINVGADHARDELLDGWKVTERGTRYYTWSDVERLCKLTTLYNIPTMVEVLLGMPGENAETLTDCVRRSIELDATVIGYALGVRLFPYSPLGVSFAEQCGGTRTVVGLQSDSAVEPIVLTPLAACPSTVVYERQFLFDRHGQFRPVCYFSPDLPEDLTTISSPNGRWRNTVRLLRELVPQSEHYRVMLPTEPGISVDDNNYADNPFLLELTRLGYKGAFWAHWRDRERIMALATS